MCTHVLRAREYVVPIQQYARTSRLQKATAHSAAYVTHAIIACKVRTYLRSSIIRLARTHVRDYPMRIVSGTLLFLSVRGNIGGNKSRELAVSLSLVRCMNDACRLVPLAAG